MQKRKDNAFDIYRIKTLKTARKLKWAEFCAGLKATTGLEITQRHILYCIEYNDMLTSDLSCIALYLKVPITYFLNTAYKTENKQLTQKRANRRNQKHTIDANN